MQILERHRGSDARIHCWMPASCGSRRCCSPIVSSPSSQQLKQAGGTWNPDRQVWEIRYDPANALGLRPRPCRTPDPRRTEHLMVDATTGRPEYPPADAGGHPGVDAGIHRWMQASRGRGGALQSNYSSATRAREQARPMTRVRDGNKARDVRGLTSTRSRHAIDRGLR